MSDQEKLTSSAGTGTGGAGSPRELLVRHAARTVRDGFGVFEGRFRTITRGARSRFERREWQGAQADASARLDLYDESVRRTLSGLRALMGRRLLEHEMWKGIKAAFSREIAGRRNRELAETFYNSLTRKLFANQSVDPEIEFLAATESSGPAEAISDPFSRFEFADSTTEGVARLLAAFPFDPGYKDFDHAVRRVTAEIEKFFASLLGPHPIEAAECLRAVFYRNKGSYIVARVISGTVVVPFVISLRSEPSGIAVDAVLMSQDEVSILFSFARSYFQVDIRSPRRIIEFLKSIMPLKPVSELYNSLGFNKHGKTEWYRELSRRLEQTKDQFESAAADRGMVMLVFGLPGFDNVFKVIRDRFDYPKKISRREVLQCYRLVFLHDRVGRLVDAQEFEHLRFPRRLFVPELLDELLEAAANSVAVWGDEVVFTHLYTERRVRPLNLYLRQVDEKQADAALLDYGYAIKELAAANIFPGDFLLKNFGVTRHGRVVFYDYDELCLLTECRFRTMPEARCPEDELSAEPWFAVGRNDVFPEEFRRFLGLSARQLDLFDDRHGDLFTARFWSDLQDRLRRGEIMDVYPYPPSKRIDADRAGE